MRAPSARTSTRSPSKPRITGREVPGPKAAFRDSRLMIQHLAQGGRIARVMSCCPLSELTLANVSSMFSSLPVAVTVTS